MGVTTTVIAPPGSTPGGEAEPNKTAPVEGENATQAALAAAAAAKEKPAEPTTEEATRPDWIPEKFWTGSLEESAKKLSESYAALEQKQSRPEDGKQKDDPPAPAGKTLDALIARAAEEYGQNKALSEETYAALEAAGASRSLVDTTIQARTAHNAARREALIKVAGDEATLNNAIAWAGGDGAYTPEEIAAFNKAVDGADETLAQMQVQLLLSRWMTEGDGVVSNPQRVVGEAVPASGDGPKPFGSMAEQVAAQRDKRYRTDPAYHNAVMARIKATVQGGGYRAS